MYEMLSGDFPFRYFIERCKTNKFNLRTNSIKIVLYNWGRGICLDKGIFTRVGLESEAIGKAINNANIRGNVIVGSIIHSISYYLQI